MLFGCVRGGWWAVDNIGCVRGGCAAVDGIVGKYSVRTFDCLNCVTVFFFFFREVNTTRKLLGTEGAVFKNGEST